MAFTQSRIGQSITAARNRPGPGIALVPFVPAGYPDLATTAALLPELESAGAAAIEIGFPFSDPIADGPTIQQAFTAALEKGIRISQVFEMVRQTRPRVSIPLVAMLSYSIVYRLGVERFAAETKSAGFTGIIIPDLPPPEAEPICRTIQAAGLETILLVAPGETEERRRQIVSLCTGFVYYLSVAGITGARNELPADLPENVAQIKRLTDLPICVGFGISQSRHLTDLAKVADGAVVGSAIVRKMTELIDRSPAEISREVGHLCRKLLGQPQ